MAALHKHNQGVGRNLVKHGSVEKGRPSLAPLKPVAKDDKGKTLTTVWKAPTRMMPKPIASRENRLVGVAPEKTSKKSTKKSQPKE